jgi:hypothetical protein
MEVDPELAERITRWCAQAGRQAGLAEIRRAVGSLGWDELLRVRALLADPPPARPLGPFALVDIARGAPPELAAEREREGRYRPDDVVDDGEVLPAGAARPAPSPPAPPRPRGAGRRRKAADVVIRRARDRTAAPAPAAPAVPALGELRRPEGRAILEQLLRLHGARRAALARALAAGWRRDDGTAPGEEDVAALLDHHGLAHGFASRERDELLHALRAAGGFRPAAADRLALDVGGLNAALVRLGATGDAERIRREHCAELRARATLAERVRLLLAEEARLADLGLLEEIEADLRARLPEHVRALKLGGGPLAEAFGRSLSLERTAAQRVAARFGLDLGSAPRRPARRTGPPSSRRGSGPRSRPGGRRPAAAPRGRPPGRPRGGR